MKHRKRLEILKLQRLDLERWCSVAIHCTLLLQLGCKHKTDQVPTKHQETLTPAATIAPSVHTSPNITGPARPSGSVIWTDVSAASGIRFRHNSGAFGKKYLPETMGSGVCIIDYDGDGWQDVLFVNSADWPEHRTAKSLPALYHNNHDGNFTDVTTTSGLGIEMYGMGCAVGDFDNDGHDDIYVTSLGGSHLFHNLGNGKFADVTTKAGVSDAGFPTGAVWFDYDNDGKLDLFVAHYIDWSVASDQRCSLDGQHKSYCTPELYQGESGKLFRNKGNGTFEDVTKKAGLSDSTSKALGVVLIDYDNDGWLDLFVTNDTQANKLYRNNHNGTFSETGFSAGVAFSDAGKARAGMGSDAADYDASGKQSLIVGNFTDESLALFHNEGEGLFADQASKAGIAAPSAKLLTFSTLFFDYDLDGLPDIFALNGHVADDISTVQPTLKYAEPPLLFHNEGAGRFGNVSSKMGSAFQQATVGRGAAYLDFDNDGDLDLALSTSNGPARLLRNDNGNANDLLRVKLVGTKSNRDAIGAKVTLKLANGRRISQMVKSGSSYLSQSELPLTFGLGHPQEHKALSLEVSWPSGRKESLASIEANYYITITEGKGITASQAIALAPVQASSTTH